MNGVISGKGQFAKIKESENLMADEIKEKTAEGLEKPQCGGTECEYSDITLDGVTYRVWSALWERKMPPGGFQTSCFAAWIREKKSERW